MSTISTAAREAVEKEIECAIARAVGRTTPDTGYHSQTLLDSETASLRKQLDDQRELYNALSREKDTQLREAGSHQAELVKQLESAKANLESDSIVGSCNCLTKTPEVQYHKPGCKYRLISERGAALARVADVERERDNWKQTCANRDATVNQLNRDVVKLLTERDALRVAFSEASHNAGPAFVAHEELRATRAQVDTLETSLNDYKSAAVSLDNRNQELHDRNADLEADAAAMRAMLCEIRRFLPTHGTWAEDGLDRFDAALATDAGASLLARMKEMEADTKRLEMLNKGGGSMMINDGGVSIGASVKYRIRFHPGNLREELDAAISPQPEEVKP